VYNVCCQERREYWRIRRRMFWCCKTRTPSWTAPLAVRRRPTTTRSRGTTTTTSYRTFRARRSIRDSKPVRRTRRPTVTSGVCRHGSTASAEFTDARPATDVPTGQWRPSSCSVSGTSASPLLFTWRVASATYGYLPSSWKSLPSDQYRLYELCIQILQIISLL